MINTADVSYRDRVSARHYTKQPIYSVMSQSYNNTTYIPALLNTTFIDALVHIKNRVRTTEPINITLTVEPYCFGINEAVNNSVNIVCKQHVGYRALENMDYNKDVIQQCIEYNNEQRLAVGAVLENNTTLSLNEIQIVLQYCSLINDLKPDHINFQRVNYSYNTRNVLKR